MNVECLFDFFFLILFTFFGIFFICGNTQEYVSKKIQSLDVYGVLFILFTSTLMWKQINCMFLLAKKLKKNCMFIYTSFYLLHA